MSHTRAGQTSEADQVALGLVYSSSASLQGERHCRYFLKKFRDMQTRGLIRVQILLCDDKGLGRYSLPKYPYLYPNLPSGKRKGERLAKNDLRESEIIQGTCLL